MVNKKIHLPPAMQAILNLFMQTFAGTLLCLFLLTEGEPGCPGLATALDAPEAMTLSSAESEEVVELGTCC